MNSNGPLRGSSLPRKLGYLTVTALLVGFVAAVLVGSPARANPGIGSPASPTSCPNQGYNPSTTIANCRPTTTTTSGTATFTLSARYHDGHLKWQACAGVSAQGSTVQLYVDGNAISSNDGGTGTVDGSGCTSDPNATVCLAKGSHEVTATDGQYGSASQVIDVQNSGCTGPALASGAAANANGSGTGSSSSKPGGALAFTGADIALMVFGASALILLGYAIVRGSRQRRNAA